MVSVLIFWLSKCFPTFSLNECLNMQVVSSREWPLISKYRACVRTQGAKTEMIDNLFKKVSEKDDEGIIRYFLAAS